MVKFDEIDRRLLALLQQDTRVPVVELGKEIGVATSTLNDRIRRLIRNGVITGYRAEVAAERVGLDLLAFVYVGWSDPQTEPVFLARVAQTPEVLECHHVTGVWNYLMKVRLPTTRHLEAFLANVVKQVPGLQRTETIIVLSSPKDTRQLEVPRDEE